VNRKNKVYESGGNLPLFLQKMNQKRLEEQIIRVVETINPDAYVVDVRLHRSKQSILRIKVDTDAGVSMAECAKIGRGIGHWLDEENILTFQYTLEVTSPGVGTPLKLKRQYTKNIGRELRVLMVEGIEKKGKLLSVEDAYIVLSTKKKLKGKKKFEEEIIELKFVDIKESKVLVSFK